MLKQNIVILGAGGAGTQIAKALSEALPRESQYDLILVSDRDTYVHRPALLRLAVNGEETVLEDKAFMPLTGLFKAGNIGRVVSGRAIAVHASSSPTRDGYVELEGGDKLRFRYLVVATGSTWNGPSDVPSGNKCDSLAFFEEWRPKFRNAKSIVLAGGGAVALELAGELRDIYPHKPIVIVHNDQYVLNDTYPISFRQDVERRWRASGIKFILNDRVEFKDGVASSNTANGRPFFNSLVVPAFGAKPNTSMFNTLGADVLDDRGFVKIEPTLSVVGHPNIFAAGDIIAFREQKQLTKAQAHAPVIVINLLSLIKGKKPTKVYKGSQEIIAIPNGKHKGAGYASMMYGMTFGDHLIPMIKGKDLFVGQTRKSLGVA